MQTDLHFTRVVGGESGGREITNWPHGFVVVFYESEVDVNLACLDVTVIHVFFGGCDNLEWEQFVHDVFVMLELDDHISVIDLVVDDFLVVDDD